MVGWFGMIGVAALSLGLAAGPAAAEVEAVRRGVREIGPPTLISRPLLEREAQLNLEMKEYLGLYGWPEYAVVQEVDVQEPFAPYEVRLYYIHRNRELVFSRVHISPTLTTFGVRKYDGPIAPETLTRLLTALPEPAPEPAPVPVEVAPPPPAPEPVREEPVSEAPEEDVPEAVLRVEAAAERAALAAEMAERASLAAQESANRAAITMERVAERFQ